MAIDMKETSSRFLFKSLKTRSPIWTKIVIITLLVFSISFLHLRFAWHKYNDITSSEAVMFARSLESLLQPKIIKELSGTEEDLSKPEYIKTQLSLERLVETNSLIRFAYLLGERNGNIIFLIDSTLPNSPDYSPPGQIYEEASDIYWIPFKSGKTVLTDPTTDRRGRWISALVPVKDPISGKVIAVLDLDYSASLWYADIREQMISDVIIVLTLLLLFFVVFRFWVQNSTLNSLSEKLAFDEALYRGIFDQAPTGIAIVNDKSFVSESDQLHLTMNPMFEKIIGRSKDELLTQTSHINDLDCTLTIQ